MQKKNKKTGNPIDKVTTENLDIALRAFGVIIDRHRLDLIIDLVELIEQKGDQTTLKDLCKLDEDRAIQVSSGIKVKIKY